MNREIKTTPQSPPVCVRVCARVCVMCVCGPSDLVALELEVLLVRPGEYLEHRRGKDGQDAEDAAQKVELSDVKRVCAGVCVVRVYVFSVCVV